jgi:hypothetical protein
MFSLFINPIFTITTNLISQTSKLLNSSKNYKNIEGGNAALFMEIFEESNEEQVIDDAEQQFYGFIRRHLVFEFF